MNTCSLLLFLFVCVLVIKDELTLDGTKPWTNGRRTQIWRIPSLLQPRRSLHCDFMDKIYGGGKKRIQYYYLDWKEVFLHFLEQQL